MFYLVGVLYASHCSQWTNRYWHQRAGILGVASLHLSGGRSWRNEVQLVTFCHCFEFASTLLCDMFLGWFWWLDQGSTLPCQIWPWSATGEGIQGPQKFKLLSKCHFSGFLHQSVTLCTDQIELWNAFVLPCSAPSLSPPLPDLPFFPSPSSWLLFLSPPSFLSIPVSCRTLHWLPVQQRIDSFKWLCWRSKSATHWRCRTSIA